MRKFIKKEIVGSFPHNESPEEYINNIYEVVGYHSKNYRNVYLDTTIDWDDWSLIVKFEAEETEEEEKKRLEREAKLAEIAKRNKKEKEEKERKEYERLKKKYG